VGRRHPGWVPPLARCRILATLHHIIACHWGYARRLVGLDLVRADGGKDADFTQLEVWAEETEQLWEQILPSRSTSSG
jgi:hypothetical protein